MKKNLLIAVAFLLHINLFAQLPVSHNPENKNVLLEEFTGVLCGSCPTGHVVARNVKRAHPDDVFVLAYYTGYSDPNIVDFYTSFGDPLATEAGVSGLPSATVNRHVFPGNQHAVLSSANQWLSKTEELLSENAYCNVALEAHFDINTRQMTVNAEVYYTGNGSPNNYLNIAIVQNNIVGTQQNGDLNPYQLLPNGNYNHMHVLRHLITGQWGDQISNTSQGTLIQRQYTYTLPASIGSVDLDLTNLEIIGFVTEGHMEVVNACEGPIIISGLNLQNDVELVSIDNDEKICSSNNLKPVITVKNNGNNVINSLKITYNINGGTSQIFNYTQPIYPLYPKQIELPSVNFNVQNSNTLNVDLEINGITDEVAGNNSSSSNIQKTSLTGHGNDYTVNLVLDDREFETTWAIKDDMENIIASGGPYNSGTYHNINVSVPQNGCYSFQIFDSYGDGMGLGAGYGINENNSSQNQVFYYDGDNFYYEKTIYFEVTGATNGLADNNFSKIRIFPNPTNGLINIEDGENMNLELYDLSGKLLLSKNKLSKNDKINISSFSNGLYLIKLYNNGKSYTKKINLVNN